MFDDKIRITMDFVRSLNISGADRYLTALIEFDALILNEDRHTNNICFIRRQDGLHIGPVFDNGCSTFVLYADRMDCILARYLTMDVLFFRIPGCMA